MPLTNAIHESLPYIDAEPSASERASALSLILAEASAHAHASEGTHESLPPFPTQNFTPLLKSEFARIEAKEAITGISTARYESQDAPDTDSKSPEALAQWRAALQNAYTSQSYLSGRLSNLNLLEKYGKNAWLEGNRQLEDVLRGLERELEERKGDIDRVVIERKNKQEEVAGEIKGLEEGWKRGVGRVLETEVAAEGVRREILERRREGAL
ncbi:related to BCAS2 family protein [Rhynchosporium agropyri]|uniref:Related to BCAS2 family protein n=1 Tax=Rhynchosporium agropyri TaxID=914238 RepID=A0A1E1JX27_9HELO|nr:related to BCAS2 family protein [Rhynchosporium agropyri]